MDRGIETFMQAGKQSLRRFGGAIVELTRRGGLCVLHCQVAVPMLLILEDDEPAGEAPSTLAAPTGGRRMRDSSKNPASHLCNLLLWKDPTLQPAKLRSSWGYGLWLGRSPTSNAHLIGTRVGIVVTLRSDVCSRLNARNQDQW